MSNDADDPRRRRVGLPVALVMLGVAIIAGVWFGVRVDRYGFHYVWGTADRPLLHKYTRDNYDLTRSNGRLIVAAINKYHARHNAYPSSLNDLVPEFLASIEHPLVGDGVWQYTADADRFKLRFFVGPMYQSDWYDSR